MKKKIYFLTIVAATCLATTSSAQSWSITGNNNITGSNFLGTTNANSLIFRTNNTERGRLLPNGRWRFGTGTNYVQIDNGGVLSFNGNAVLQIAGNKYAFQIADDPNIGLFYNQTSGRFEFRNSSATPVFSVNALTGAGVFNNTLTVGAYTLPSFDGTNGQVLKTNGTGVLAWGNDNNNTYTSGNGIDITGNIITNTAPDQTVVINAGAGINVSGTYPGFTISNSAAAGWSLTGNGGTVAGTNFIGTTDNQALIFKVNNQLSGMINSDQLNTGLAINRCYPTLRA